MLNIIVFLRDNISKQKEQLKEMFDLDVVYIEEEHSRYVGNYTNGRCYFHYDKSIANDYSKIELSSIPYVISDICDISFYPPEMLPLIVSKLVQYDNELFVDDDYNGIVNIVTFSKKIK